MCSDIRKVTESRAIFLFVSSHKKRLKFGRTVPKSVLKCLQNVSITKLKQMVAETLNCPSNKRHHSMISVLQIAPLHCRTFLISFFVDTCRNGFDYFPSLSTYRLSTMHFFLRNFTVRQMLTRPIDKLN